MSRHKYSEFQPTHEFHSFPKLPYELQLKIWKAAMDNDRRIYELYRFNSKSNRVPGETPWFFSVSNITLCECSTQIARPYLAVDRISRRENLRYYHLVRFNNAAVHINLEIDTIYLGSLATPEVTSVFAPSQSNRDPLWSRIRHLAFGMEMMLEMLIRQWNTTIVDETDTVELEYKWGIPELREFAPNLESFTLVLDEPIRDKNGDLCIDGYVAFRQWQDLFWIGTPDEETPSSRTLRSIEENLSTWIHYFTKQWSQLAIEQANWKLPSLFVRSVYRGDRIQQVNWDHPQTPHRLISAVSNRLIQDVAMEVRRRLPPSPREGQEQQIQDAGHISDDDFLDSVAVDIDDEWGQIYRSGDWDATFQSRLRNEMTILKNFKNKLQLLDAR